jgi:hypothetical protein
MSTIRAFAPTGLTLVAQLINNNNQRCVISSVTFEAYNSAHFSTYNIVMTEQGSSGVYVGTLPVGLPIDTYGYVVYQYIGSGGQTESDYQFLENGSLNLATGISSTGVPLFPFVYSSLFTFQKSDVGVMFIIPFVDIAGNALDISGATIKDILVIYPDRTLHQFNAAFYTDGTDGYLKWTTALATDLPQAGTYQVQGYISSINVKKFSAVQQFQVLENLGVPV